MLAEAVGPQEAVTYLQKAIALRDRSTISVAHERLMNLAAKMGNIELMKSAAAAALSEEDVNPALKRRLEPVVKGGAQKGKLQSPEDLLKELAVQISTVADRDSFFFRNLFTEGAALNCFTYFGDSLGQIVVSVDTYHQAMGTDGLKTQYRYGVPKVERTLDMATAIVEYTTSSTNTKGDVVAGQGSLIAVTVKEGDRWWIQSLCLQSKPKQ